MTRRAAILALALLLAAASPLASAGTTSGEVLRARPSARAQALGGAYASLGDDWGAAFYNPAGLAALRRVDLGFLHYATVADVNWEAFGYAHPTGYGSFAGAGLVRHMPDIANPGATDAPVSSYDILFGLSYAQRPAYWLPELLQGYAAAAQAGVTVKYLRSHLGNADASTVAADLGARMPLAEGLNIGLALVNLGPGLRYLEVTDPLPAALLAGVSKAIAFGPKSGIVGALEGELPGEGEMKLKAGAELRIIDTLFLRAGYVLGQSESLEGFSAGAGIRLDQEGLGFRFDYCFKPLMYNGLASFEAQHLLGAGLSF